MEVFLFRPYACLLCALISFSCESKEKASHQEERSRAPSTKQQEPETTAIAAPWFVGSWQGKSELGEELSVEDQDAPERGERLSGQGLGGPVALQLNLVVTEKDVRGTAELGEHVAVASGVLLDESLRVNFRGETLQGMWSGVRREASKNPVFSGFVRVSTTRTEEGRERVQRYSGLLQVKKGEEVK